MGRRKSPGKRTTQDTLKDKGVQALIVGVGLLLAPVFMGNSPITRALAGTLTSLASMALLLGAVLLGAHYVMRHVARQNSPGAYLPDSTPVRPAKPPVGREPGFSDADVLMSTARVRRSASPRSAAPVARSAPAGPAPRPARQDRRRETTWSAKVLEDIEWRRFEAVCERLFAQGGFETRSQSHGADGGVDIWLHSRNSQGPAAVVQCKHWNGKQVGVKEVREFFGVMASHQLKRGTYVATSGFTADALRFAKDNGINAMDGERLLALIATRTPGQQQEVLDVAYEGEYWRPTCASCGPKMVERHSGKDGSAFWGCVNFPRCRNKLPMRQAA
jgi:restriction system protein